MDAADKMKLSGSEPYGLLSPTQDFVLFEKIGFGLSFLDAESAKRTTDPANVRRIDVGVDDVIRPIAVTSFSNGIRRYAKSV